MLEVTCQVVMDRGFANTRVSDVAAKLGVSTGLVHYHFTSKNQLLAEAFRHAANADLERLQHEISKATTAIAKLDKIFKLYSPVEAEPGWMLWIDGWGEALRNDQLKRISQELDDEWKQALQIIITEGVANGEFACADPHGAAWRLAAILDGLAVQVTVHEGTISRSQLSSWVRTAASLELGLPQGAFVARKAPKVG